MFRDQIDLFSESNEFLFGRFRLPRPVLIDLCIHLEPALRSHTLRSNPVPPAGTVDPWLFAHWNISTGAGGQGGHITATLSLESWMQ